MLRRIGTLSLLPPMRWRFALIFLWLCRPALAGVVPLSTLPPTKVTSDWPARSVTPTGTTLRLKEGVTPEQAVRLVAGSQITYAVPAGQSTFSAILAYEASEVRVPGNESVAYNEAVFRILLDGKLAFERGLSRPQPPLEFSLPLSGAREITILSRASAADVTFSLLRPQFSGSTPAGGSWFLPVSGSGYVDCTPMSRQAVIGAFFPGETVPITASFAGQATEATVTLEFTPDDTNSQPVAARLPVRLAAVSNGVVHGTANWRAPNYQGPAKLTVDEAVNGLHVFHQELRVAVIPSVDLSRISNSSFGVHISGSGFPLVWDEFAYIWGAKWGRLFVRWPVLEPSHGQFDFSRIDALVGLYQAQNMQILVALGEDSPAWAGVPGTPSYMEDWKNYIAAVVKRFAGKVEYWDVFNEVDSKYGSIKGESNWDIEVLRAALQTIHAADPAAKTVCCSTGSSGWLQYDKRIFDAGLLNGIDILSLHPYSPFAPERKSGLYSYVDAVQAPRDLARSYGASKPIWSTEANWIIGPAGNPTVTAPGINEKTQAEYVARVNLISFASAVPYFLHAPFVTGIHPQVQLETLAAYAAMTSLLSGSGKSTMLSGGPDLWGFYSAKGNNYVGALWSTVPGSQVRLSANKLSFLDMYGNSLRLDSDSIALGPEPIYFLSSSAPQFQTLRQAEALHWRPVAPPARWACSSSSRCFPLGAGGMHVVSSPSKYAYQLTSPSVDVSPQPCQTVRIKVNLKQGAAGVFAVDDASKKILGKVAYANFVPDGQAHEIDFNFNTSSATAIRLIVANANAQDSVSDFYLSDPATANCQ